ncbi:MAG: LysR family transcriptional regulator [Deltaproteobacteria bacterium]|nr:LysR family transcriptional regulator [Deltaproteobacteria bacterium]
MELRHLRYFVCVAEEGNVGRAALRLHISQPPLTRQVRDLEREVGAKLFERTHRGVELTNAGAVFLDEARRILELADAATERAQRAGKGAVGRIDIALFGTGIFGVIPILLRRFRDDYPDVKLVLHNMTKAQQLEALEQDRIDLAFNRLMRPVPGLVSEVLLREPLFIAAPSDHPIAKRPEARLRDFEGNPVVVFPTGTRPSFIDYFLDLCTNAGFSPNVVAEVDDVVHGLALVATGGGLCLVPRSATNLHLPGLTYRPLRDDPCPTVDLCCIRRERDTSPILARLLESMRETAAGLDGREVCADEKVGKRKRARKKA